MNAFEWLLLLLVQMLEKHLGLFYCKNTFLLYVVVEIAKLVNEVSSFPEVLYKRCDLKNFSKFIDKHKKQSSGGVSIWRCS